LIDAGRRMASVSERATRQRAGINGSVDLDPKQHHEVGGDVDGNVAMAGNIYGNVVFGGKGKPAQPLVPRQLPPAPGYFIGRHAQVAELATLAEKSTAAVVIAHPATGIGKSALVVHWAHRMTERFPDGLLHIDLRGSDAVSWARSSSDVVCDILLAFGVETLPPGTDAQLAFYRNIMWGKRVLLVLDDARNADQVRPLLLPGPESMVVITSRNPLTELIGQGARWLPLDVLDRSESRELLSKQIGAERAAAEPAAIDELVELCAGLPGALGAVAGVIGTGELKEVAADLSRELADAPGDAVTRSSAVPGWARTRSQPPTSTPPWQLLPSNAKWLLDRRLLIGVAVALCAAVAAVSTSFFEAAGLLGAGYFLLRFALLGAGLILMGRDGPSRSLGAGAVAGSAVYLLVDALVSIHGSARMVVWLELIAALVFVTLLVLHWRPMQYRPRRLKLIPPSKRPLSFAVLASVLTWFILLFAAIPIDEYDTTITMIGTAGALGALFPLLAVGGLSVAIALTEAPGEAQRLFAGATIVCYLLPEFLLLAGSLALGPRFAYLGHGIYLTGIAAPWLTIVQTVVVAVTAAATLTMLHGAQPARRRRPS
jgi:NB-ARC domain